MGIWEFFTKRGHRFAEPAFGLKEYEVLSSEGSAEMEEHNLVQKIESTLVKINATVVSECEREKMNLGEHILYGKGLVSFMGFIRVIDVFPNANSSK